MGGPTACFPAWGQGCCSGKMTTGPPELPAPCPQRINCSSYVGGNREHMDSHGGEDGEGLSVAHVSHPYPLQCCGQEWEKRLGLGV